MTESLYLSGFDINTLIYEARKTSFGKNNVGLRLLVFLGMTIGYFVDFVAKVTGKSLPGYVIPPKNNRGFG